MSDPLTEAMALSGGYPSTGDTKQVWKRCPAGSCQRHGECMYVNHPQCTAKLDARKEFQP
jgi:hypothetical protein